jgi:hypothetical protein
MVPQKDRLWKFLPLLKNKRYVNYSKDWILQGENEFSHFHQLRAKKCFSKKFSLIWMAIYIDDVEINVCMSLLSYTIK